MNFNAIGGSGGGGGGPLGTTGCGAAKTASCRGGGAGAGFVLNLKRLRSTSPGFVWSASSDFRCTSGAVTPLETADARVAPRWPAVVLTSAEGRGHST